MGGGSRSTHQHHSVDAGLSGSGATAVVTDAPTSRVDHVTTPDSTAVHHMSYAHGEETGTLEVQWRSNGLSYQFTDVPEEVWQRIQRTAADDNGSVGSLVSNSVVGEFSASMVSDEDSLWNQRSSAPERSAAGGTPTEPAAAGAGRSPDRCSACGQFVGADLAGHNCPVTTAGMHDFGLPQGHAFGPPLSTLLEYSRTSEEPLLVPVSGNLPGAGGEDASGVEGHVAVFNPNDPVDPAVATAGLRCDCGVSNCGHTEALSEQINNLVRRRARADENYALMQQLRFGEAGGAGVAAAELAQARCPTCGRFIGGTTHECPVSGASVRHYPNDYGGMDVPNITALHQNLNQEGDQAVQLPISARYQLPGDRRPHLVRGDATIQAPPHQFDAATATAGLDCTCGEDNCRHAQLAAAELLDRVRSQRVRTPDRRASTAVLGSLAAEHGQSVSAQQQSHERWPTDTTSFVDNHGAFESAFTDAQHRISHGEPAVAYQMQDATGGLGARDGGRGFGVELEFDLPADANRDATLRAIAEDMHRAGISQTRGMDRYHASMREGYSDARNAWRLERDATVAGEIVSPILYDTPETWRDLATVCDIVRRHGGRASVNAGGHVHVSAHNYDHTVENHNRLMGLVDSYQDTLFRLASNPSRGQHRGTQWCEPNRVPARGYRDIGHARTANSGHHLAVNMQSVGGRSSDHVEFRMWDASLDPAIIQSQVKVSLGLTEAAFRAARTGGSTSQDRIDRVGAHHARFGDQRPHGEQWQESTRSFRSLVDTIFHRDQDKAQLTGLFAITRWQQDR